MHVVRCQSLYVSGSFFPNVIVSMWCFCRLPYLRHIGGLAASYYCPNNRLSSPHNLWQLSDNPQDLRYKHIEAYSQAISSVVSCDTRTNIAHSKLRPAVHKRVCHSLSAPTMSHSVQSFKCTKRSATSSNISKPVIVKTDVNTVDDPAICNNAFLVPDHGCLTEPYVWHSTLKTSRSETRNNNNNREGAGNGSTNGKCSSREFVDIPTQIHSTSPNIERPPPQNRNKTSSLARSVTAIQAPRFIIPCCTLL